MYLQPGYSDVLPNGYTMYPDGKNAKGYDAKELNIEFGIDPVPAIDLIEVATKYTKQEIDALGPYRILGVPRNASVETILSAFNKKAIEYHLEKSQENVEAFLLLKRAKEALIKSIGHGRYAKRTEYDNTGFW